MKKWLSNIILSLALIILLFPIFKSRVLDKREIEREVAEVGESSQQSSSMFEIQNKPVGYLEVPAIDLKLPIYKIINEYSLSKGVGLLEGFDELTGDKRSILTSHNGLSASGLFTNLDKLKSGDIFIITNDKDEKFYYEVYDFKNVLPTDKEALPGPSDTSSLLTCSSVEGPNSHRLIVTGKRVANQDEMLDVIDKQHSFVLSTYEKFAIGMCFVILIICLIGRRRKWNEYL